MKAVQITLPLVYRVYKAFNESGDFLTFYQHWQDSEVFEIPSGYLRFEHHPPLRVALVHGIFFGNPFKDTKIIENMIYLYIEKKEAVDALQCIVPTKLSGVNKLCKLISDHHIVRGDSTIYF